ncbi:hypothetical protein KVR01_007372 [Diaporthe batatas]|uniref:uncharacterized protein n=1 Tax=Diaporthe batatas TaxID=748121 RepID=UPI001D052D8A|nr:uncharacterized protein KVR01_007372 [Diaporthe batatas]KAG8162894.1 hypothetical protein KVR01_007372 [Diaporthe batatas]
MPSYSSQDNVNFLYVTQVHSRKKRRRPSFWGCRPRKSSSSARDRRPRDNKPEEPIEPSSRSEASQAPAPAPSPRPPARQARHSPAPPSPRSLAVEFHKMDGRSPIIQDDFYSPEAPSSARARSPPPVTQPFRTLVASVKRCPWAPASGLGRRGQYASDDFYYPPVPRSLLHDTAVSFVVKDHTRPDLPEFVISCPFENVDLVHQLLAPDGSGRQLTARGTSGQPRSGDQLRSMLLDGTPSIELALHADPRDRLGASLTRHRDRPGDDGIAEGRMARFVDSPVTPRRDDANTRAQRWGGGDTNNGRRQHTSLMYQPASRSRTPVATGYDSFITGDEPDVEQPRTSGAPASPLWIATPLRAPSTPASSSPPPSGGSEHSGTALLHTTPSPLHFQATVESAPPTPSTGPLKAGRDEPAVTSPEEEREEERAENQLEEGGDTRQEGMGGNITEPPALVYVEPAPGQLERGVPLTGWLCDPAWLRQRLRHLTMGNTEGN